MSKPRAIIGCIVCELIIILAICFVPSILLVFILLIAGLIGIILEMLGSDEDILGSSPKITENLSATENTGERVILFDDGDV